jgi:hypothetical protein
LPQPPPDDGQLRLLVIDTPKETILFRVNADFENFVPGSGVLRPDCPQKESREVVFLQKMT